MIDNIRFITILGQDRKACQLALKCASAGFEVKIYVEKKNAELSCFKYIYSKLSDSKLKKELNSINSENFRDRIKIITEFELAIMNADIIINFINPLMRRRKLSLSANETRKPDAILLIEADTIFVEKISKNVINPEKLLAINLFYPFSILNTVELLKISTTSEDSVNLIRQFFLKLKLKPKLVYSDNFNLTYNRILFQFLLFRYLLKKRTLLLKYYQYNFYKIIKRIFFRLSIARFWFIKSLDRIIFRKNLKVNIGGGAFYKRHWRVLDLKSIWYSYPSVYIDYNFNLMSYKPLPFKDNSVKLFYTSHTFEHIPQEYCQHILNEIYRSLKKNGAVRIVLPDFDIAYEAFGKGDGTPFEEIPGKSIHNKFLQFFATSLQYQISSEELEKNYNMMKKTDFADYYSGKASRETQKTMVGGHINWWNFEKLKKMLSIAGFNIIERSKPHQSKFKEMRGSKNNTKFDTTFPKISLFVEAIK